MKRRLFINQSTVGVAATVLASPAIAQSLPEVRWRCASSFPKSLDTIYGGGDVIAKRVAALTDGKFKISLFGAGELMPAFDTTLPFGLNQRMQNAWMYWGGGLKLQREFLSDYNIISFPAGNTGTQMGGWFRKPIKGLADLKGLKMRIAGLGGEVLSRLGGIPQQIAGGDIYPALERGVIDAAEWVGPYDDEKLGFYKIAPNYYYPGWWEACSMYSMYVNTKEWEKLPKAYQSALEVACYEANSDMMAEYDYKNPEALGRLLKNGVKLFGYSQDIMKAAQEAAFDLYAEEAAKNPAFKKIYEPWKKFRTEQFSWSRVAEQSLAIFMLNNPVK